MSALGSAGDYFYRYRSATAALDGYHELERSEIYFSTPSELNDPMEGFKDLIWLGESGHRSLAPEAKPTSRCAVGWP